MLPKVTPFDLTAIRARALAEPGAAPGFCRWCGKASDQHPYPPLTGCLYYAPPSTEEIACADRAALLAEYDRLREAIADFIKRARGTVHGQRNGDADEVLR